MITTEYLEIANTIVEWCIGGGIILYVAAIVLKKFDPFNNNEDK